MRGPDQPGVGATIEWTMTVQQAVDRGLLASMFTEHTGGWPGACDDDDLDLRDNPAYPMGRFNAMYCVRCALLAVERQHVQAGAIAASELTVTIVADVAKIAALGSTDWSRD